MSADWVPTARLRWVERSQTVVTDDAGTKTTTVYQVLQQWYAADVPGYLRREGIGEWRDVPVTEGEP